MVFTRIAAFAVGLALASGCSAGTRGFLPGATAPATGDALGAATVTVQVPLQMHALPRPHWISPSMKRISIVLNGPTKVKQTMQISPAGSNCAKSGRAFVCTLTFALKPGN